MRMQYPYRACAGLCAIDYIESDVRRVVKTRHAYPREFEIMESLPKARSGKIVRMMIRARELMLPIGDVSTLMGGDGRKVKLIVM